MKIKNKGSETLVRHKFDVKYSDESFTVYVYVVSDGTIFTLLHQQDCCEHVRVYGSVGNIDDVINVEVIDAEDTNPMDNPNAPDYKIYDSATWTQFRIVTNKGTFEIWWLGESNGYYSESVSVIKNQ